MPQPVIVAGARANRQACWRARAVDGPPARGGRDRGRDQPGGPDPSLLLQPANAIRDALRRDGTISLGDLDLIEINESFAAVALASIRDLGVPAGRVNVNGGAICLSHPVGMSGARLALILALELRRRGGGTGAAALCGGGQGDALITRVPEARAR